MNRWLGFAVGAAVAGFIYYQVQVKQVGTANGKFLGVAMDDSSYGFDDVLKGAAILGGAALAIKMAHGMGLPASTALPIG